MAEDVVEETVSDWVEETTPRERVHSVMKRAYGGVSPDEAADQAETTPKSARKHLEELAREGFVTKTSQPDRETTLYKRSSTSLVIEEATRINDSVHSRSWLNASRRWKPRLNRIVNKQGQTRQRMPCCRTAVLMRKCCSSGVELVETCVLPRLHSLFHEPKTLSSNLRQTDKLANGIGFAPWRACWHGTTAIP